MVSVEKLQHTKAVLEHHQDMVALIEKNSMHLKAIRSSRDKLLIGTYTTDADAEIVLAELKKI